MFFFHLSPKRIHQWASSASALVGPSFLKVLSETKASDKGRTQCCEFCGVSSAQRNRKTHSDGSWECGTTGSRHLLFFNENYATLSSCLLCSWRTFLLLTVTSSEPSSASFPESRHRFTSRKSFQNWRLLWRLGDQWPRRPGLISSKAADINQRVSSVQTTVRRGCLSISIFVGGGWKGRDDGSEPPLHWHEERFIAVAEVENFILLTAGRVIDHAAPQTTQPMRTQ